MAKAKEEAQKIEELRIGKIESERREEIECRFEKINGEFFSKYFNSENQFNNVVSKTILEGISLNECEAAIEVSFSLGLQLGGIHLDVFTNSVKL